MTSQMRSEHQRPREIALGREVVLGARPEAVHFDKASGITVTVQLVEPTGPDTLVMFELNGKKCLGRCAPSTAPRLGQNVQVMLDVAAVTFFDPQSGRRIG